MADGKAECPACERNVPIVRLGNSVVFRPHNDKRGNRCPGPRKGK